MYPRAGAPTCTSLWTNKCSKLNECFPARSVNKAPPYVNEFQSTKSTRRDPGTAACSDVLMYLSANSHFHTHKIHKEPDYCQRLITVCTLYILSSLDLHLLSGSQTHVAKLLKCRHWFHPGAGIPINIPKNPFILL